MDLTDRVAIPAEVMVRQLGEEAVILDLASGTYFGLDAVGNYVWERLQEGRSLAEICAAMTEDFEVSREVAESDILSFVRKLQERGLVQVT